MKSTNFTVDEIQALTTVKTVLYEKGIDIVVIFATQSRQIWQPCFPPAVMFSMETKLSGLVRFRQTVWLEVV